MAVSAYFLFIEELLDAYNRKGSLAKSVLVQKRDGEDEKTFAKRVDYLNTYDSLNERQPELCRALLKEFIDTPSIKVSSGELNLRYERNEPQAVAVCFLFQIIPVPLHKTNIFVWIFLDI